MSSDSAQKVSSPQTSDSRKRDPLRLKSRPKKAKSPLKSVIELLITVGVAVGLALLI